MNVYRIQPQNADLHGLQTETSNGELAGGVHVFTSLQEAYGCREWRQSTPDVEFLTIRCEKNDLKANGDYEGVTLKSNRGEILNRRGFLSIRELAEWLEPQI